MFPTFENAIAKIGITTDGIGTPKMAGAGDPTQALPPELTESIPLNVEEGYSKFINIVAVGRDMDKTKVNSVAQGRVWDGTKAKEIGLVDELGNLAESVRAAAKLAGLKEYAPLYLHHTHPPASDVFKSIGWWSQNTLTELRRIVFGHTQLATKVRDQLELLVLEGDPAHMYAHSLIPLSSFVF